MPKHKMVLSTTEPNNNIPLVRIIQDDKNSHTFEAEIVEDGQLLQFENEVVFFNAEIGTYKVRDKVDTVFYDSSRVSYQLNDAFLQKVGEFNAWFSFANSDEPESDLFSTMRFTYRVLPGIRKNIWEGNYFWDLQELVDYYKRYKHLIAGIVENEDFSGLIDQLSEIDGRTNQLDNFATASKIDAEQGVVSNKFMTPQRVTQQTSARLATDEEARLGANSTKLMTPQATKEFYDANMVTRHFDITQLSNVRDGNIYLTRMGIFVVMHGNIQARDDANASNNAHFAPLIVPTGFKPTGDTGLAHEIPAMFGPAFGRVQVAGNIILAVGMNGPRWHNISRFLDNGRRISPDEAENTLPRLYFVEALEQLREKLDPKLFNVGIVTDSHFDEGTWRTQAYQSMKNLNNVLYIQNDLDAIAALGDNVDSEHRDKSINVRNLERYCARYSQGNNPNKFIIRGNHDSGSAILDSNNEGNNVFEKDIMTGAEQLEIFKKHLSQEGKFYGNGQYHYKDFHQKKIRMVFIDMIDNPLIRNQNGTLKYVDQWSYALQERQLQWLAEEALGTLPDDYHVAIFSHVPLMPETVTTDPIKNGELLKALLTAFINKESTLLHSNLSDFVVDFSVDFTQRKESHLIGLFAGHRHEEYFYSTNEMGGYYSTVFDCAFVRDDSKLGLVAEDAFAVLEIDTAHRKVRILGFGRATDREYTY